MVFEMFTSKGPRKVEIERREITWGLIQIISRETPAKPLPRRCFHCRHAMHDAVNIPNLTCFHPVNKGYGVIVAADVHCELFKGTNEFTGEFFG